MFSMRIVWLFHCHEITLAAQYVIGLYLRRNEPGMLVGCLQVVVR